MKTTIVVVENSTPTEKRFEGVNLQYFYGDHGGGGNAFFSDCGKYRYLLSRQWDDTKPVAMCIGLNPSTAGATQNDPTINNLTKALKFLGFGGLRMTNLYAYIATKPSVLWASENPIGPLNNEWLLTTAYNCQEIIFCWGGFKRIEVRVKKVKEMFPSAKCFGKNANGSPLHPMALMWQGINEPQLIKY